MIGHAKPSDYGAAALTMPTPTYTSADTQRTPGGTTSLDEVLFDAKATAKILTSHVSMYLRDGWRDKLFYQLDNLLDPEEWDPQDKPLQEQSFNTFLKAICDLQPKVRPGLGISHAGHLIAAWRSPQSDRVSIEFVPGDRVKLVGTTSMNDDPVHFSALASVANLKATLRQFNCAEWIGCSA